VFGMKCPECGSNNLIEYVIDDYLECEDCEYVDEAEQFRPKRQLNKAGGQFDDDETDDQSA